ncbi:C40 family peptidase [Papillibacter cinnamivorans]|uniref:NlpC/P60 family protein n=1 Tax=Papillibacter cinnamivorans DSM 12816 TaxID=1122930 RepID=A0A1W2ANL1_9FIRM|nr:NlpC/P60 family protein [Papillibacter cinnamivorans]SMC62253.1 NlpC/P60 family protein [Papillibacter cinnamivorans DSM 12816]
MSKIKTRETLKDIKALDKAAIASERMRDAFIRSKDTASNLMDDGQVSPSEYANDKVQYVSEDIPREVTHKIASDTKKAAQSGREAIQRRRIIKNDEKKSTYQTEEQYRQQNQQASSARHSANAQQNTVQSNTAVQRPQAQRSDTKRITNQGRELTRTQTKTNAIRQSQNSSVGTSEKLGQINHPKEPLKAVKQPGRAIKQTGKATAKSAKRTVKTGEHTSKVAVKTAQNTARAAQKSSIAAQRAAKLAVQSARAAARAAAITAKAVVRAISVAVKAIIAAVKGLIAAIAAGGWVAVVAIVLICLIGMIIASPFGIFFAGENTDPDAVPVSAAVAQVNYAFNEKLETIQSSGDFTDVVIKGSLADWPEVLAIFAVKVAGSDEVDATDVATLDPARIEKLKAVFWDMNSISSHVETISHPDSDPDDDVDDSWSEKLLHITIAHKTAEDMTAIYNFSEKQNTLLEELLVERDTLLELIGEVTFISADAAAIIKNLPDNISPERKVVIKAACSLVGKVNYFWGGKSLTIGWDSRWGTLQKVTADESPTTGTYRPYGMDCSGFVDWVFYNASDGKYIISHGSGASAQHSYCQTISWDEAMPGDLVFYPEDEHVGIVAGRDEDGNLLIIHCSSGYNNVVITGVDGFTSIGRPLLN